MEMTLLIVAGGVLVLLLVIGAPFYIAFTASAIVVLFWMCGQGLRPLGDLTTGSVRSFILIAVPLFILLGNIMAVSGASAVLFELARAFMGHVPGGLGMAAVVASCLFGTMCGSAVATALAIGAIVVPELMKHGYSRSHAAAICGCSGGLGTVMPPSIGLIILGQVLRVNVGDLFMAAIIPAIIMMVFLCTAVYFDVRGKKEIEIAKPYSWSERRQALVGALPVAVMPLAILGSIWGGIATPTEAAGVGCVIGLLLARFYFHKFGLAEAKQCLRDTAQTAAPIFLLIAGAVIFGRMTAYLQIPQSIAGSIETMGLGLGGFRVMFYAIFFLLGMIFDCFVLILIALPPVIPAVISYGIALIPFGVLFEIIVNIGQVTPPTALVLYSASIGAQSQSGETIRCAVPYILTWTIGGLLFLFVPAVSSIY